MKNNLYLLKDVKREDILAKITIYNYKILKADKFNDENKVKFYEDKKQKLVNKVLIDLENLTKNLQENIKEIKIEKDLDENQKKRQINLIQGKILYLQELNDIVYATCYSVENGKVNSIEQIKQRFNIKTNISCLFSLDVYKNFKNLECLESNLINLWYRSVFISRDMPIFITNSIKKEYEKFCLDKFGHYAIHYNDATKFPILRDVFDKNINFDKTEKELYESVFPEFNFKYEDREEETTPVYSLEFKDKYL